MNPRIEQLKSRLQKLEDFIDSKDVFQDREILAWIAASVTFLVEVGVSSEIIQGFMQLFEFKKLGYGLAGKPNIGPFVYQYGESKEKTKSGYRFESSLFSFGQEKPSQDIYYVRIAFAAARSILNRAQDEERIVPKFLINILSESSQYAHIVSSLELIEKAYSDRNPDGLCQNTITLLDSVLDLDEQLKTKDGVSKKLKTLMSDNFTRSKFGVEKEFVFALDNSRLIRNQRATHKNVPLKYDIPFIVVCGCAYLAVMFLENTIAAGEIFVLHKENDNAN